MKQFNQGMLALAACFSAVASADQAEFYTPSEALVPQEVVVTPESITLDDIQRVQSSETYTYVRCWYRTTDHNHNDPATDWKWALKENGDYFTIDGYWYSSVSFKNMFYTNTRQDVIKQRCEQTLNLKGAAADITYFAADNRFSYNHSIWTNDNVMQPNAINKVVVFGDSLSDTGNFFNASQWLFPNRNAWFLGHFSNGYVWNEYVAAAKGLPMYNWAVGGAAGSNQYLFITGVNEQVTSYLTYMKMAKNYRPQNTLFTLEFGLNDFVNYGRSVDTAKADFGKAMETLYQNGAKNLLTMTLPDASKAPQFKYAAAEKVTEVRQKIQAFNQFIVTKVAEYQAKGMNISLFDTHALFESMTANPQQHGFQNATDSCLDINRSSSTDYLTDHSLRAECAQAGSDAYIFWGVTHPTTATHKYIADRIAQQALGNFVFN